MRITFEHERFAVEYVRTGNASIAYRMAYPDAEWSSCGARGSELSRDKLVGGLIEKYRDLLRESHGVDAQSVIDEMKKMAFADITDIVDFRPITIPTTNKRGEADEVYHEIRLKGLEEIPENARAAISEISTSKDGSFKVRMHSKHSALKDLGAHLGLFTEKVDVSVNVTHDLSDVAKAALSRIRELRAVEVPVEVTPDG